MKRAVISDEVKRPKPFTKGAPRVEGAGRQKGSVNKTTALLKDAIIMAAELEGSDRKGKDGLVGYLRFLARKHPVVYERLLEKLLPYQLSGAGGGPVQVEYKTKEELVQRMKERGLVVPPSLMDGPAATKAIN